MSPNPYISGNIYHRIVSVMKQSTQEYYNIEQQEEQAMRHERTKNENCSEPSIQELNSKINETFSDSDEL